MKISIEIVLKLVRQLFLVLGSIGTWIGIEMPAEAQQGVEGFIAAIGPFLFSAGLLWSWIRDVIKWLKGNRT